MAALVDTGHNKTELVFVFVICSGVSRQLYDVDRTSVFFWSFYIIFFSNNVTVIS